MMTLDYVSACVRAGGEKKRLFAYWVEAGGGRLKEEASFDFDL